MNNKVQSPKDINILSRKLVSFKSKKKDSKNPGTMQHNNTKKNLKLIIRNIVKQSKETTPNPTFISLDPIFIKNPYVVN